MRSRLLINLLLLVLVAGLGAYLFIEPGEETVTEKTLTPLRPDMIDSITILRRGLDDIRFTRQDNEWKMQSPYRLPAHPVRINQLLLLAGETSLTQMPVADIELERFRLDEPEASVILNGTRIDFGDTHPLNENRYVRVGDTVYLIDNSLFPQLRTSPTFYLDTRLLPTDRELVGISLPGLDLQSFDGQWTTGAAGASTDVDAEKLALAWQYTCAITVQRYEPAEPYGRVSFQFREGEPLVFELVGNPEKPVLARSDAGIQYHLSAYDRQRLFPHAMKDSTQEQAAGASQGDEN